VAIFTRVQHNSMATTSTTATNFNTTLGSGVTVGNLLVATISLGTSGLTLTPPTGWLQAGPSEVVASALDTRIYYLVVTSGGVTSYNWSFGATAHSFGWTIDEWNSDIGWAASPVDSFAGAAQSSASTAVNCGSPAATAQASELWYGVLSWADSGQSLSGVTSGWTTGDSAIFTSNNTNTAFYQTPNAIGTPSLAATLSAARQNAGVVATFKSASAQTAGFPLPQPGGTAFRGKWRRPQTAQWLNNAPPPNASPVAGAATAAAVAYNPSVSMTGDLTVTAGAATASAVAVAPAVFPGISLQVDIADKVTTSSGVANSVTPFSPVAGSMVVISATWLDAVDLLGKTFTCQDSLGTSYTSTLAGGDSDGGCYLLVFEHTYATAPGAITVKITCSNTAAADCLIQPYELTGQAADQSTAAKASIFGNVSVTTCEVNLTTTQTGSYVFVLGAPNNNNHPVPTALASTTTDMDWDDDVVGSHGVVGHSPNPTATPGTVTYGWTLSAASIFGFGCIAAEVIPATPANVTLTAGTAAATGAAGSPVPQVGATDQSGALATGTAFLLGTTANAGTAAATGAALQPTGHYAASSAGTGAAQSPVPQLTAAAGVAAATGAAPQPVFSVPGFPLPQPGSQLYRQRVYRRQQQFALSTRVSPALTVSGFGAFSQVPPNAVILAVIANITQNASNAGIGPPLYQLWDGVTGPIGSSQAGTFGTSPHVDSIVFTGVTYSQLPTLQLRVYGTSAPGNSGATLGVDAVSLSVEWAPNADAFISPAVLAAPTAIPKVTLSTGSLATPGVLAAAVALPAAAAGELDILVLPGTLAAATAFPPAAAGAGMTALPGVLTAATSFPPVIDVTAAGWASAENIASGGSGNWTSAGAVLGTPDGSDAIWTAP
jgi:hypothetical protein